LTCVIFLSSVDFYKWDVEVKLGVFPISLLSMRISFVDDCELEHSFLMKGLVMNFVWKIMFSKEGITAESQSTSV